MSKRIRMSGSARTGLTLLIAGAIIVGLGSYLHRGAVSLYGLVIAIIGFSLYIISSTIFLRKRKKKIE
jgi:membrane-bound ClpP family serine protease